MPDLLYKNFHHESDIQIRFCDLDGLNHVNNANYLSFIELARTQYFNHTIRMEVDHSRYSVILAKATIDYKVPILWGDTIKVYTRCSRLGNKSFDLEYAIVNTKHDEPVEVATAHTIMVTYDYKDERSIVLLPEWRQALIDYEGGI